MNYQVTCLTPTLCGDGRKLAPIDYMVWKDQVNILDQNRIFKLLSKGPRLDGYLTQLKTATKLDFASWGGFAQNFAGRRIPFEHSAYAAEWNKTGAEYCAIPTFSSGPTGAYLPGAAIKGALRTGLLVNAWKDSLLADLPPRRPGEAAEKATIGSRTRNFLASDSNIVPDSTFKIYLVKTATMQGTTKLQLGWKPVPYFAEMAVPGSVFEGNWRDDREHHGVNRKRVFAAANDYAASEAAGCATEVRRICKLACAARPDRQARSASGTGSQHGRMHPGDPDGAGDSSARARCSTQRIRTTARFCRRIRSMSARSAADCLSRRHGALFIRTTNPRRWPAGLN